jgi:hypothetical protein
MKKIKLTRGKYALVDDEDFPELNKYKWCCVKSHRVYYAVRRITIKIKVSKIIFMHRVIMHCPKNKEVDHEDNNGLNCQKYNLRICNNKQNRLNSRMRRDNKSGYKGVGFHYGKYIRARIQVKGKEINLGYFPDVISAARAYDEMAIKHHGKFARLNFPQEVN